MYAFEVQRQTKQKPQANTSKSFDWLCEQHPQNACNLTGLLNKALNKMLLHLFDGLPLRVQVLSLFLFFIQQNTATDMTCSYLFNNWLMKQNATKALDSFFKDM